MIAWPAWPLPLAAGLLPAAAVLVAWGLSIAAGLVPDCLPWIDGCTSISRAARHGHGNVVFKMVVLPCTVLQALHWALAREWLRLRGREGAATHAILALGLIAAVALAVYATYLGTEGRTYGAIRRFGFTTYFGATFVAMLLFVRGLLALGVHRRISRAMLAIGLLIVFVGIASVVSGYAVTDDHLRDRLEDLLEWHLAILLTGAFVLHAALYRASGFRLRLYR